MCGEHVWFLLFYIIVSQLLYYIIWPYSVKSPLGAPSRPRPGGRTPPFEKDCTTMKQNMKKWGMTWVQHKTVGVTEKCFTTQESAQTFI